MSAESTHPDNEPPLLRAQRRAGAQLGLITRSQARADGMSDGAITYRLSRGWQQIYRGVFVLPGYRETWDRRVMAACLRGSGVASHVTAARLLRLEGVREGEIHIYDRSYWSGPDLRVHRARSLPACDLAKVGPIPTTNASRTLLDLGAVADEEVVETCLEHALRIGLTSIARLRWRLNEVGRSGHPGTATLRRLLDQRDLTARPAQSVLEVRFIRRIRARALPEPVRQLEVAIGRQRRYIDFAFPHALLGVEVGGRDSHSGPAAEQRDSRRHNELISLGWRILYFTWDDIEHRMDYVVACIQRELQPPLC